MKTFTVFLAMWSLGLLDRKTEQIISTYPVFLFLTQILLTMKKQI